MGVPSYAPHRVYIRVVNISSWYSPKMFNVCGASIGGMSQGLNRRNVLHLEGIKQHALLI